MSQAWFLHVAVKRLHFIDLLAWSEGQRALVTPGKATRMGVGFIVDEKCSPSSSSISAADSNRISDETATRCQPTWDGWQCWEEGGTPDSVEYRACPSYIYFHTGTANDGGQLMQNTCGSKLACSILSSLLKWSMLRWSSPWSTMPSRRR